SSKSAQKILVGRSRRSSQRSRTRSFPRREPSFLRVPSRRRSPIHVRRRMTIPRLPGPLTLAARGHTHRSTMRIRLVQSNANPGHFDAIDALIDTHAQRARNEAIDLLIYPELFFIGGPGGLFATR